MPVPNQFANVTTTIPLSQLDANFNTPITLGNTAIQLGNTVTTLNNMTFANVTISSVSTPITAAQGGTGLSTLASNNVLLGNGTGTVQVVAPGSAGNVLTSTGTTWTSNAASSLAVTSFSAGTTGFTPNSATQGAVTLAGTLATTNGGTGLTSFTANGVLYASSTSALATGSAFTFDGSSAVISVNSATDALRITQTGAGNALLVEDSANPDSTPFVIDSNGTVIVGTTTSQPIAGSGYTDLQVNGTTGSNGITISRWTATAGSAPFFGFKRSRGATIGTAGIVQSGDTIGQLIFYGDDGVQGILAAGIQAFVDGTPGTNDMPGRLAFYTTADGASSLTERMRIDSAGNVGIGATPVTGYSLTVSKNVTGAVNAGNIVVGGTFQSDVTTNGKGVATFISTQASAFTLTNLIHFEAQQGTIGSTSAVTNQYGFYAFSSLTGATNNYGFFSNIASGTGRWNFYANGTAKNIFAGQTSIGGLEGAESLRVVPTASAVNWVQMAGGATGLPPSIISNGSDTNVDLLFGSKGTGALDFRTNGGLGGVRQLYVSHTASAVNYVQVGGAATGGAPFIISQGSDTNINLYLGSKGTGAIIFNTSGLLQFAVTHTASAVNYLNATGSATGAAPTLSSQGSDTNINLALTPKGTGSVVINGTQINSQPAETAQNTSVTLSVAQLQTQIITSNAAVTLTLPTGTTLEGYTSNMAVNTAFDVIFIATTASAITIGANGNTTVGNLTVSGNTSGRFRFRKTATNTFTVYRIA